MDLRQQDQFSRKCHRFEALEQTMALDLEENKKADFSQHLPPLEEDICQVQRPTGLHGFRDTWEGHKRLMLMILLYRVSSAKVEDKFYFNLLEKIPWNDLQFEILNFKKKIFRIVF